MYLQTLYNTVDMQFIMCVKIINELKFYKIFPLKISWQIIH